MIDSFVTIAVTALTVTAVGIALRPGAPTAKVVSAGFGGLANVERSAYGPN